MSPVLQIHFWEVLLDVCVVVLVGKLLEPLWGAIEMLVFFMVVNVGVAMVAAFFYYFLYMITFNVQLLFNVHIHGKQCSCYYTLFSPFTNYSFKQDWPDT